MRIGEGAFYSNPQLLYVPKAAVTALELEEGDKVEFHIENHAVQIRKAVKGGN